MRRWLAQKAIEKATPYVKKVVDYAVKKTPRKFKVSKTIKSQPPHTGTLKTTRAKFDEMAGAASKGSTDDLANLLAGDGLTKSNSVMAVSFLTISIKSKLVIPQVWIFTDSFDLSLFVLNPLATAINLLLFLKIDDANEYFSTVKYPVLIPSAPKFLYNKGFLLPCVIGSPPVLSQVNSFSL